MFGFLSPKKPIAEWRRSYARICQHQRELAGLLSLPFLSYEATFLYQLAIDFGLLARLSEDAPQCCRLRRIPQLDERNDHPAAMFAASFGLLLAGVKLDDDVQDHGRWHNRFLRWMFSSKVYRAKSFLDAASPNLTRDIAAVIREHDNLEGRGSVGLEEYVKPTGQGFRRVFSGFAAQFSGDEQTSGNVFSEIGQHLGKAIIAWDCAVDFKRDRILGQYNPLSTPDEVQEAFDHCLLSLAEIGWLLPAGSASREVVASVVTRVRQRKYGTTPCSVSRFERWGFIRQRGRVYAGCDGLDACCVGAECCECLAGADAGCALADCGCNVAGCCSQGVAPCDPCCCEVCCEDKKKRNTNASTNRSVAPAEPSPWHWCAGKKGVTEGHMSPRGYVVIDDERVPAKSLGGTFIEAGTQCVVVDTDPFGVTVRPA